ncbi:MAG: PAS domain S-box protein, partial [Bacteroidales bacterium]|nr:PAS domain S-box protein [Bacteroidales bacterium]
MKTSILHIGTKSEASTIVKEVLQEHRVIETAGVSSDILASNPDVIIADAELINGDFIRSLKENALSSHVGIICYAARLNVSSWLRSYYEQNRIELIKLPFCKEELEIRVNKMLLNRESNTLSSSVVANATKTSDAEFKYQTVVENASEGILLIQDNYIVFANRALSAMLGYSLEELYSVPFHTFLHKDDKQVVVENHQKRLSGNKIPLYQVQIRKKDGTFIIAEVNAARFKYKGRAATVNFVTDITSQVKVAKELKENEERYRLLFSNSIEAITIFSADTLKFIDANEAFCQLYGYTKDELLNLTVKDISAEVEKSTKAIKESVKEGDVIIPVRYHKKKDGTELIVRIAAGPFTWKGEKVMYSIIRDVTEQVELEKEVRESKELLQNMADSIPAFIGVADAETIHYKFVNKRFVDAYKKERSEIIGAYYADVLGQRNADFAMKYINEVRQGKPTSYINTFDLDHGRRYINVNFTPSFDSKGEVKDIIILSHDITQLKQAEQELKDAKEQLEIQNEELQELNATKNKFFSIIAHDLKSPFNALLGIGSLLKENLSNGDLDEAKTMADLMYDSASSNFDLLENLLEWSRVQINRTDIMPKVVKVTDAVGEVIQLYEGKAHEKDIAI